MLEYSLEELKWRLNDYPPEARAFFKEGFNTASKLSEDVRSKIVGELISNFNRGKRRVAAPALRAMTGVNAIESEQLMSAYSLIIGLLADSLATPDEFLEAARDVIYAPENEATVRAIVTPICESRIAINAAVQRAQLAGKVLPSFQTLECTVDLRVQFADGKLKTQIPVAIAYLNTDAQGQRIWVQMTKGDVEDTIKNLQDVLAQMILAESLVPDPKN